LGDRIYFFNEILEEQGSKAAIRCREERLAKGL
jgi:hypothetical protein